MAAKTKHLWEVEHPYYWTGTYDHEHESWASFLEDWGGSDEDLNLVTRWDWLKGEDDGLAAGQEAIRFGIVHQRKGTTAEVTVTVTQSDEAAIRAWLQPRWEHMKRLWAPFST